MLDWNNVRRRDRRFRCLGLLRFVFPALLLSLLVLLSLFALHVWASFPAECLFVCWLLKFLLNPRPLRDGSALPVVDGDADCSGNEEGVSVFPRDLDVDCRGPAVDVPESNLPRPPRIRKNPQRSC